MPAVKTREPVPVTVASSLYERDLHAWAEHQVAALREGRVADLDLRNLAQEIQDVGSEQFSKVRSAFRIILLHMLKWDGQPEKRTRSWVVSIRAQRVELEHLLELNPSLRRRQTEAIQSAYRRSRIEAAGEMGRAERMLPADCPYGLDDVLGRPFDWPEA